MDADADGTRVVAWTAFHYSVQLRADGSGAADTRVVTWTPAQTDGTSTLDRWTPDHTPVALSPEQCHAAQASLERFAESMRERAERGAFGEPLLNFVEYGGARPLPSADPAPAPAPAPAGDAPVVRRGGASRSRSRSRSPSPRRVRRPRRSTPSPDRRTRRSTPSPDPRPRRTRCPSPPESAVSTPSSAPVARPADAVRPPASSAGARPKKAATKPARVVPKRGAMAAQSQSWKSAWTFNTLPGSPA